MSAPSSVIVGPFRIGLTALQLTRAANGEVMMVPSFGDSSTKRGSLQPLSSADVPSIPIDTAAFVHSFMKTLRGDSAQPLHAQPQETRLRPLMANYYRALRSDKPQDCVFLIKFIAN